MLRCKLPSLIQLQSIREIVFSPSPTWPKPTTPLTNPSFTRPLSSHLFLVVFSTSSNIARGREISYLYALPSFPIASVRPSRIAQREENCVGDCERIPFRMRGSSASISVSRRVFSFCQILWDVHGSIENLSVLLSHDHHFHHQSRSRRSTERLLLLRQRKGRYGHVSKPDHKPVYRKIRKQIEFPIDVCGPSDREEGHLSILEEREWHYSMIEGLVALESKHQW